MLELRRTNLSADVDPDDLTTTPILSHRGFVAVPTPDVQEYVRSQFLTFAAGFVVGMGAGAIFGNLFSRSRR